MIIDFEQHYLPEELWRQKGGKTGQTATFYEHGKPRGSLHPELYEIDTHLKAMDAVGIDMAVLSIAVSNDDTRVALEESIVWDSDVARLMIKYPKRFAGLAPVPPLAGEKGLAEIDRAVGELGMRGVVIRSQVNGMSLDNKELYPFYKKMQQVKVPVFVHPSGVQQGFDILNAPYDLNRTLGRELDLIVATTRLILSGVLDDFPDLVFVMAHKGGGVAAQLERLAHFFGDRAWKSQNKQHFRKYLDRFYFNLAGHHGGMNSVKCALLEFRPDQLMFGTDYPQEFTHTPEEIKPFIDNLKKLPLKPAEIEAILSGTARKVLKI